MIKPPFFTLTAPKSMVGDNAWAVIRQYARDWNAKQTELTQQVRLNVWHTLNRLACYFAQAWREGKTTGFSFFITRTYSSAEAHPKVKAGEMKKHCCIKTIYNHLKRLVEVGILAKESMQEHTKYQFKNCKRAISCLMLTWSKDIIALLPQDEYTLPQDAPSTHAELVLAVQKLTETTFFKRL